MKTTVLILFILFFSNILYSQISEKDMREFLTEKGVLKSFETDVQLVITSSENTKSFKNNEIYLVSVGYLPIPKHYVVLAKEKQFYLMAKDFNLLLREENEKINSQNALEYAEKFIELTTVNKTIIRSRSEQSEQIAGTLYQLEIITWTKINGISIKWNFQYKNGQFHSVRSEILSTFEGDYQYEENSLVPGSGSVQYLTPDLYSARKSSPLTELFANVKVENHNGDEISFEDNTSNPEILYKEYVIVRDNGTAVSLAERTVEIILTLFGINNSVNVTVTIEKGGTSHTLLTQTISTNLVGYGSYSWEIPDDVHTGKCRIVATDGSSSVTKHFFIYRRLTGNLPNESDYDYKILYGDQFADFNETNIETYASNNRTSISDTYQEEIVNWNFNSPKDIDPDEFFDIYVGDFNNGYANPTSTGFDYIAMGYPYKDLLKNNYGYTTDLDAIGKVMCHEFLHAVHFHYRNITENSWRYVLEGQARFIQTVYLDYHSSSGNEAYKGGRQYQNQSNSYLGTHLNSSLTTVSYNYCLFWRFLYENYQSGNESSKLKILRDFLAESENVGSNQVEDGETAFDNVLSAGGGSYTTFDDALKDFAKHAYLNDPTHNLWNPVPNAAFYRTPFITGDTNNDGVTATVTTGVESNSDAIPVSFGIDYLVYNLDASVNFLSIKFDGNPDDDGNFADFYANVLKMNGNSLYSEEEISLTDGKGNISFEANNPIDKVVIVVNRLDAEEGSRENNYNVEVSPGVEVAFIIDDTGSMWEEIAGVREALLTHLATYDPNSGTVFQLTTFKDYVTVREPTTNLALIQSQVAALYASGGGDCPEASVEAINQVIDDITDNGRAFLATDAAPHPGLDIEGSIAALRAKGIRVDVVLSGDCYSTSIPLAIGKSKNQEGKENIPLEKIGLAEQNNSSSIESIFTAIEAFSLMAQETGGIFAFIPEVNHGDPSAIQKFENTIFNITQGGITQSLAYIQPSAGPVGGTLSIQIVGAATNFRSNTSLSFEGNGVNVNNINVVSPSLLEATISIDHSATLGFRNITATTDLGSGIIETATGIGAFEIINAPTIPTILGITPPLVELGQTQNVTISGINTHFTNTSILYLGSGVAVNHVNATSETQLEANITISGVAPVGFRDVIVNSNGEIATENVIGPFFVSPVSTPLPKIISVVPSSGSPNVNMTITINGENTTFTNSISNVSFSGSGIDVLGVNVLNSTQLAANIYIHETAEPEFRDVRVTTGPEVAVLLDGFLVTEDIVPEYPYLFLSNEDISISKVILSDGAIHANDDIEFLTGYPGSHYGDLSAVDDITIRTGNTIYGNVTAGDNVKNRGTINGIITENGSVDPVDLPVLGPYSAGVLKIKVSEGTTFTLDPGSYSEIEVRRYAKLQLKSGEYFIHRLKTLTGSIIEIDVDNGPVTVNVVNNLYFGPYMEVAITSGETASNQVTFNSLQSRDLEIRRGARVMGTIIAPQADVEILSYAQYRGSISANDISVNREATLLHHNSTSYLPDREFVEDEQPTYQKVALPTKYELEQNFPNPFNPETVIRYALPEKSKVSLKIYNINGQLIKSLVNDILEAGYHRATWKGFNESGEKVASGIYFYRLQAGNFHKVHKMFFLK